MSTRPDLSVLRVLSLAAGLSLPALAAAQVTAPLTVQVKDTVGVLPGAAVTVVRRQSNTATRQVTDGEGRAEFAELVPGEYDVVASLAGFADSRPTAVTVTEGQAASIDVVLSQVQFSDTVTVSTPARREELLLNVPDPMTLIERTQIQDTGARTSKDLLIDQSGSGVQVQAGGGQGHVSINGIPNSGVLVLVDGRRFLGKDANGNLNLEDIELTGVERVEVVKGAGSALYGSDALGGVINIITRKSQPGLADTLQVSAGTYDDYRVTNTLGYRRGPGGFSLATGYRTYDGFDLSAEDPQTIGQPESEWQNYNLNGDYKVASWLLLRGFGSYQRRQIDNYYFRGAAQIGPVYNSRRDLKRFTFAPDADLFLGPDTQVTLSYTYGKYDRRETQEYPNRDIVQVPWLEWNKEFRGTGRRTWRAWGQDQFLQAGYEYRGESLDRASLRAPGTDQRRQARDINVLWAQQEFGFGPRLRVSGGFRYDNYEGYGDEWSPKVTAVYSVTGTQRARFTYGQGFRAPYFNELYLYTPPAFVGNPDLEPEKSNSFTAGYAFAGEALQASVDFFHNRVENGITFDLSRRPFTYANLREYTSRGLNTSISASLPFGFVPQFSYAHVAREDDQGREVGGLPRNAYYLKLLWSEPRYGLRANLRAQLLDDVKYEDGTSQPAYQVWNLQVSKRFLPRSGLGFSVFGQVDNLFDETDLFRLDASGSPVPGDFLVWIPPRTFLAGLIFDFSRAR